MRLELVRSGGFAGLEVRTTLDTAELPAAEARAIEAAIRQSDVPELERRSPLLGRGADRFEYDLTVTDEGQDHRLVIGETEVPAPLKPVLRRLEEQPTRR